MPQFDWKRRHRRPNGPPAGDGDQANLEELREQVPEVDDLVERAAALDEQARAEAAAAELRRKVSTALEDCTCLDTGSGSGL